MKEEKEPPIRVSLLNVFLKAWRHHEPIPEFSGKAILNPKSGMDRIDTHDRQTGRSLQNECKHIKPRNMRWCYELSRIVTTTDANELFFDSCHPWFKVKNRSNDND